MLREDIVKDDNGHKAVFTEQGASASRVAAATFVNTVSRLRGMAEEANDAVIACVHVYMSETHRFRRSPQKECPQVCITLPHSRRPKQWDTIEEPVVLLEENLNGHLLAVQLWERRLEDVLLKQTGRNVPTLECH